MNLKKFFLGLICGIGLTATTAVYASDTIQAYLFPVRYEFNGQTKQLDSEYTTLNYNGHAYVPIRFVAESLGVGIRYLDKDKVISIMNEPTNIDEFAKKVWLIHFRLNVGNDQRYVKELIGEPVVERTNEDNQQAVWRYDYMATQDYQYGDLSNIDFEGLGQGKIRGQLLINWSNEGKLEEIQFWYTSSVTDVDRKTYSYILNQDGSTSEAMYE